MPAMIELLGVGAPRPEGGWTLHRVCATFARGEVTLVVSHLPEERDALLDAVVARLLPEEGRVWVSHIPVSRDTIRRIRGMVAEVDLRTRPVEHRSLLWNVLVAGEWGARGRHGGPPPPPRAGRHPARPGSRGGACARARRPGRPRAGDRLRPRRGRSGAARARERAREHAGCPGGTRDRARARRRRGAEPACGAPVARAPRATGGPGQRQHA